MLTGAGMSTESGIPDYRGPKTLDKPRNPIVHDDFVRDAAVRQRYWARATVGWPRFAAAQPNAAHHALASLQRAGVVHGLITQNVDGLHAAAGSDALELHGTLHRVGCLGCGAIVPRPQVHARMVERNDGFVAQVQALAPDGDVDLAPEAIANFEVVSCLRCGGALKPEVVFFGGAVARPVVERAYAIVLESEALLVVGSSLTVFSGFRFVRRAAERGLPIVIVNLGPSRGDPLASVCVDEQAGVVLPALANALT